MDSFLSLQSRLKEYGSKYDSIVERRQGDFTEGVADPTEHSEEGVAEQPPVYSECWTVVVGALENGSGLRTPCWSGVLLSNRKREWLKSERR